MSEVVDHIGKIKFFFEFRMTPAFFNKRNSVLTGAMCCSLHNEKVMMLSRYMRPNCHFTGDSMTFL